MEMEPEALAARPRREAAVALIERMRLSVWDSMRSNTGPFLSLTAQDVGPDRSRAVLGYIESVMLFPDHAPKQERAIMASRAETVLEEIPEGGLLDKLTANFLRNAPPLPEVGEDLARRFAIGAGIGHMVIQLLNDPGTIIRDKISEIENRLKEGRPKLVSFPFPPIENVQKNWWPRFRPVSHLWAASLLLRDPQHSPPPFPCSLAMLPEFLAQAELIRCLAQRRKLVHNGDAPLLELGKALAVAPELPLPHPPFAMNVPAEGSTSK